MAIPKIKIPSQFIPGIKQISLLSEDDINALYETLRQLPKAVSRKKFLNFFSENLKIENVHEIAAAIFSFGHLLKDKEIEVEDLASDLTLSYEIIQNEQVDDLHKGILKDRLKYILLLCGNLSTIYELFDLLYDNNNIGLDTEITTNTSLLFNDDSLDKNGFISHRLKIRYREDDKPYSKSFAFDNNDLKKLKSQIELALTKEENIKTNNKGIINFIDLSE